MKVTIAVKILRQRLRQLLMWCNSISKQLEQAHRCYHYFICVQKLMEICVSFLSQLRWFISNRCFSPLISGRKPASLNLQPLDTARQAEGQSSNSCTGDTLPMRGLLRFSWINRNKGEKKKLMSCLVNIAAQTLRIDEVAVLPPALSLLKHIQSTTVLRSHWCFQLR